MLQSVWICQKCAIVKHGLFFALGIAYNRCVKTVLSALLAAYICVYLYKMAVKCF